MRARIALVLIPVIGLAACRKPNADEHVRKADAYAAESKLDEAILEYRVALQAAPGRGDIRLKLADAYLRNHNARDGAQEIIRAADQLPKDLDAQEKAGSVLLLAGRFADAKDRAEKALAIDPKNAEAQILLGNALAGMKDLDGALNDYQAALALNPAQDAAYSNIAAIQMARGQVDAAEASFKKALEVAPKSVHARLAYANFLWATNRAAQAEGVLKDTLALEPANLEANRALGIFYLSSGRPADAEPYFKTIATAARTTDATVALADYYAALKRYDDARKVLTDLLGAHPETYATATTRLAAIDAAQGLREQALARIGEVLGKFPNDMAARLLDAQVLAADGKHDDALTAATKLVTDDPQASQAADAYLLIGQIDASIDHLDAAVAAYQEVLKRKSQALVAELALARLYLAMGQPDKANTYTQDALGLEPKNPLARSMVVRVDLARRDTEKARHDLASLEKDFPNAPTVLDLVAGIDMADRQVDAARAAYGKAYAASPGDLEATAGLVEIDLSRGHAKDALARIDAGLKVAAPTGDFLVLAARAYAASGDAAKAEALLKQAMDAEPARLTAYELLGSLYIRQHRLDDAIAQFQQVISRDPKSVPASTMLGMLFEAQGHATQAESQYQKTLAIDESAAVAANNLAWLYVASNRNLDQALALAQTAQRQLPNEPHVNDTLGWVYYRKNIAASAVPYLEQSVAKNPSDPGAHYHLGMAYAQIGETAKAKKALEVALGSKTAFDGQDEARTALKSLGG